MPFDTKLTQWTVAALCCVLAASCADDGDSATNDVELPVTEARDTYAKIVLASYEDSLDAAEELNTAIEAFLDAPSEAGLEDARQAWLDAREPYLQTEVYRFYEGPIDNAEDGPEGAINAWPLDEAYIDYVEGDLTAGIINDVEIEITAEELEGLNELGGEENIATGFHAIEFLLWGQDTNDDGPGNRPYTDYVEGDAAENADRRAQYLRVVSDLLVTHLQGLVDAWAKDENNYRADFEQLDDDAVMERILTGMITLTGFETGGERLQTALVSGDQEDEHSCFSDNTHRDMIQDIQGVWNVWHGKYESTSGSDVSGVGVRAVVAALNEDLAKTLDEQIDDGLAAANDLHVPFDQEIAQSNSAGNERVGDLVSKLRTLEGSLQDAFHELGLSVPVPE